METYEGKAKRVVRRQDDTVELHYKDDATAFNGVKHAQFQGKGALNSQITEKLFGYLTARGVRNHHLGRIDELTLHAEAVTIILLEAVGRFKVAGSLQKRTGLEYLAECSPPIIEFYYKRDDLGDPLLNSEHIRLLGVATEEECATIHGLTLDASLKLRELFAKVGIDLVDLKFEFGRTAKGELILADEISPDTCRFRDAKTGEILDKDLFRFDGGDLLDGYRKLAERLDEALATRFWETPVSDGTGTEDPRVHG
jgi:phosphoribosylaminoimidazole-succinocarboxamide synthase